MLKKIKWAACSLGILALCLSNITVAQSQPRKILFIGDSFTHGKFEPVLSYNKENVIDLNYGLTKDNPRYQRIPEEPGPWGGIPGIFKQFTMESGLDYTVSIEAVSARGLSFHANPDNTATPLIFQAKWDVVVMQDLSTGPLPDQRKGKMQSFLDGVKLLNHGIHAANPRTKIYLYETWPRADLTYAEGGSYFGEPLETMANDLFKGYVQGTQVDSCCSLIPVGNAWMEAIKSNVALRDPLRSTPPGQVNLWGPDFLHPSVYGSFLSALVIYRSVTGLDPRGLGYEKAALSLGISRDMALQLEDIASRVALPSI